MKWCSGRLAATLLSLLLSGIACTACGPTSRVAPSRPEPDAATLEPPETLQVVSPPPRSALQRHSDRALEQVAATRQLKLLAPVRAEQIGQPRALALLRDNVGRNVTPEALLAQGEVLRGFGLIPAEFDFVEEMFLFASRALAGMYDPQRKTLFVLEGVRGRAVEHVLFHELAHALHDQHFDLDTRLRQGTASHKAGAPNHLGDKVAAELSLAEGDATAVAFQTQLGRVIDASQLRDAMLSELAMQGSVPDVLRRSMVAPYHDGLAFVQRLREVGGWAAVNRAWQRPPRSTEQLLHLDKFERDEAPLAVPASLPTDTSWSLLDSDVVGEQGLRAMFTQWGSDEQARQAAAGWGGDRYVVMQRKSAASSTEYFVSLAMVLDTQQDADEVHALIRRAHPLPCQQRTARPLVHAQHDTAVALVAGPFQRTTGSTSAGVQVSAAACMNAQAWLRQTLAQAIAKLAR